MKLLFFIFFLVSAFASAQTTVTGTIVDPNGNAYANGTAAAYSVATSGQPTSSTSPVSTNGAGFFTLVLNANTYVFTICAPPVNLGPTQNPTPTQVCFTSSPIAISGGSQDVSTQLNAVAKLLGPTATAVPGGVASGSQLVSRGLGLSPIYQTKPFIDMRDLYDCSYATDSATALNTAWANGASGVDGSQQTFPIGCHIKLGSTFTVQNHTGFLWRGFSSPGAGGTPGLGAPTLSYCGTAGGTVLNMQYANSPTLENLIIDGKGAGCSNGAGFGIVFDKTGPGSANTTFGVLRNVQVSGGVGGSHNSAFVGLNFNPVSSQNGEDFLIDHSFIYCQSGVNIGTETTVGIQFNQFNNKSEQIFNSNVIGCNVGLNTGPGGVRINGGDWTGNEVDVAWGGNSDPFVLDNFTSENSPQSISTPGGGGGSFPNMIANSHFSPGNSASATHCTVSLGDTSNSGVWTFINNGFDDPTFSYDNVSGSFPICSNQNNHLVMMNDNFVGAKAGESLTTVIESGNSQFILPNGHNFGADYSVIHGGYFRVGGNFTQAGNEDMGYGFLSSLGSDVTGLAYNNSSADGNNAGGLSIGRDAMYLADANIVLKGVWPVPSQTVTCTVNGTAGSTRYSVKIFAKDGSGNRSGWVDYVGNAAACINAQATFSAGNSLTISWNPVAGETNGYDVVLMNPAASTTQGWLAGATSHGTTTLTVTSGPGSYSYSFPNYYDSAKTTINGASLTINPPTTINNTLNVTGVATLGSGSTKLIQTNTASNSDLAGELSFSAATTSNSYSFTGTYTSHPECTITPQFSPGASHVIWISTLSTSALQLSSDTAQTGTVSYICIGRN